MHLNLFLTPTGHHEASWRHPASEAHRAFDVSYYREIAAIAEAAKFDSLFLGDQLAIGRGIEPSVQTRLEPLTLLSALSASTERIGLIGTASTTYTEPYNLARQFTSLDHISAGRAGWNMVTSWSADAAGNFGGEQQAHAERYERATEYLDVATKLWDSWEDGARIVDRESGHYLDAARVHAIDHRGDTFNVRGPLNMPRSPQGRPVLVQAGSSEDGRTFAARYAEAIFTAQPELADAQRFYAGVKARAAGFGRSKDSIKILPGLSPFIGSTHAEARAAKEELDDLTMPEVGLRHISSRFNGFDLSGYPLDGPVPIDEFPTPANIVGAQSRSQVIIDLVKRENLTLRQLLRRLAGARGHCVIAGTPDEIAGHMVAWVEAGAADGFNIMPPRLPYGLAQFVDEVVPLLRRRGVFRKDYEGLMLRDHYGLPRPQSRFAAV